jgi:hypothetical protein
MPTSSGDLSLINETRVDEPVRSGAAVQHAVASKGHPRTRYADAFDALESGLPMSAFAPESEVHDEPAPKVERHEVAGPRLAPAETRVPFMMAALVLAGCLTVGGATAALVLHQRVTQITASWTASR